MSDTVIFPPSPAEQQLEAAVWLSQYMPDLYKNPVIKYDHTAFFGPKRNPFHLVVQKSGKRTMIPGYSPADLPVREDPKTSVSFGPFELQGDRLTLNGPPPAEYDVIDGLGSPEITEVKA